MGTSDMLENITWIMCWGASALFLLISIACVWVKNQKGHGDWEIGVTVFAIMSLILASAGLIGLWPLSGPIGVAYITVSAVLFFLCFIWKDRNYLTGRRNSQKKVL